MPSTQAQLVNLLTHIKNSPLFSSARNFCNICNKSINFEEMFYRPTARCPQCNSLERHRAMAIHIWPMLPSLYDAKILHFAAEQCLAKILTSVPNTYIKSNYDISSRSGIDIRNIPYQDKYFDLIIANQILEHIDDDKQAICELFRVIKNGGKLFVTVPFVYQYQSNLMRRIDGSFMTHLYNINPDITYELPEVEKTETNNLHYYGQQDHLRIYGKASLKKILTETGFIVDIISPFKYPKDFYERLNIIDDIVIAKKP